MRQQDTTRSSRNREDFRVRPSFHAGLLGGQNLDTKVLKL